MLTLYLHTQNGPTNAQLGNNLEGVPSLLFTNNTAQIEAASDSWEYHCTFSFMMSLESEVNVLLLNPLYNIIKYIVDVN